LPLLALLRLALLLALLLPLAALALIAHALIERLHAADEIARLVGGTRERILLRRLTDGAGRVADFLLQRVEVGADVVFHPARDLLLRSGALLERALRVADLLADALVTNAAGRFVQLARGIFLVTPHLVRELLELLLEVGDFRVHRLFPLAERLRLRVAPRAWLRLIEVVDVRRHFLLLVRQFFRLPLRALEVAVAAAKTILTRTVKDKVADNLVAKGIEDFKGKLN